MMGCSYVLLLTAFCRNRQVAARSGRPIAAIDNRPVRVNCGRVGGQSATRRTQPRRTGIRRAVPGKLRAMTVDQLIAEARAHRKGAPEPLTMENLAQALRMMIGHALKSTDVEAEPSSTAAQTARLLAMLVAAIEDQQAH